MAALCSEDDVLARIDRFFVPGHPRLPLGRGDDCCVLSPAGPLCVSTDLFLEDVHFRRAYFTPEDVGRKALAVNLSDLAACGARPVGFSLGLALPPDADEALVDGLFRGLAEEARPHGTALTGGDLSRADKLHLCLTVFGEAPAGGALTRGGCRPGDVLFLIGRPGLARVGLARLEAEGRAALEAFPAACTAHLRPVPRVIEGLRLAALCDTEPRLRRCALMDVSDGLAGDLPRLLGSPDLGADLVLPAPHPEVLRHATDTARGVPAAEAAAEIMLQGGEDYALLGACDPKRAAAFAAVVHEAVFLGTVSAEPGIRRQGRTVRGGFDHFGPGVRP